MPKHIISSKANAEKYILEYRKMWENMYKQQNLLDSTKSQIGDLLRRKPDVRGADRLTAKLDSVANAWMSLHELCKNRTAFGEITCEFHDTYNNLNSWLTAIKRMEMALGPTLSNARMMQSHAKQVQVLREEFRVQQLQRKYLLDVGHRILGQLDRDSSAAAEWISTKLGRVKTECDDLADRFNKRALSLIAVANASQRVDAAQSQPLGALATNCNHKMNLSQNESDNRKEAVSSSRSQRPMKHFKLTPFYDLTSPEKPKNK